jgi:subtilisin family serine protease
MKKFPAVATAVLSLVLSLLIAPSAAYADSTSDFLNKVMGPLVLPTNHDRLDVARKQVGADWTIAQGYTGKGVSVVVMDEGTQADHVQLSGRIIQEVCTSTEGQTNSRLICPGGKKLDVGIGAAEYTKNSDGTPYQWADHGTMVSSGILEFAPDVRIISIKSHGDHLAALDWVIANAIKYNIASVNMSFGGNYNERDYVTCSDDPGVADWKSKFEELRKLGVAPVAAAGNDGRVNQISHPGCQKSAVSVGAVTPADKVIQYSNVSSDITLLAPTEYETATVPQKIGKTDSWTDGQNGTAPFFGGTSAATPVVSALLAIGKSVAPSLNMDQIIAAAVETGTVVDDRVVKGLKRVQFDKFVQKLLGQKGTPGFTSTKVDSTTKTTAELSWKVVNDPTSIVIKIPGEKDKTLPGIDGVVIIPKPTNSIRVKVTLQALDSLAKVVAEKIFDIVFPDEFNSGWCNPTGKELTDISGPIYGWIDAIGPNQIDKNLVDLGISITGPNRLDCTYVEISSLTNPGQSYIARITSKEMDRHQVSVPKDLGSGLYVRMTFINKDGDYAAPNIHKFPTGYFHLANSSPYERALNYNSEDLQPELLGVLQFSKLASLYNQSVANNSNGSVIKQETDLAQANATIKDLLAQIAELKAKFAEMEKYLPTTIECVRRTITKKVTAVNPKCPAGYKKK